MHALSPIPSRLSTPKPPPSDPTRIHPTLLQRIPSSPNLPFLATDLENPHVFPCFTPPLTGALERLSGLANPSFDTLRCRGPVRFRA
ncbi:uncharacterized protein BKA78DRAFT_314929 [Phyllosticta capitalensis]|uniref:uncharacterized protein n=1 Tax=Phyllosticta capitalensis TaxID=121624 RepID=UPI003131ED3A